MKKLSIIILLSMFAIISCDDATTEPNPDNGTGINIIGVVTIAMIRTTPEWQLLDHYYQTEHISGIKVELLRDSNIVATTYTVDTDSLDCFYIFKNLDKNVEYRVKASLNNEVFQISEPFVITDPELKKVDRNGFIKNFGSAPDWFETGRYYIPADYNTSFNFDFWDDNVQLIVGPQPTVNYYNPAFNLEKREKIIINVLNKNLEFIKQDLNITLHPGYIRYRASGPSFFSTKELEHGLYFINLKIGEKDYYFPLSVFRYRDDFITSPYKD